MKITKRQLRRIIREEKARIIAEQRDDRAFLASMKTIMEQLMELDPESRIENAQTLIENLESVIDQAGDEIDQAGSASAEDQFVDAGIRGREMSKRG